MALIEKNDLRLDYDWSTEPGDTPADKDSLTGKTFNPERGEDVLNVLNNYAEKREIESKDDITDAETLIREKLPKDLNTEENVLDWLWSALGNEEKA